MKNKFFKTLAIFGLSVIAWNCSDDPATSAQHTSETPVVQPKDAFEVDINCWMLNIGTQTLLIVPDALGTYTVTDPFSIPYGTYDVATGTIYDLNGNVVITNVDTSTLPILSTDKTVTYLDGTRLAIVNGELVPLSNGITVSSSSTTVPGTVTVSSSSVYNPGTPAVSSSSAKTPTPTPAVSSSSQKTEQPVASSSSQQQQPKSSSSQPKSSSSQQQQQNNPNAGAEEAKYLNAGAGGQQGFATRYWDCCMPHCAWPEHGGAAKTCDAKGKTPIGNTNGSICSGGQGTTCTSQIPIIVSDKLAYAFAATPGNDATCGKCFALTFTGTGKYETKANHKALAGKTLVVMASNIGYDVQGGQFDIMIPGGGVGLYNGCSGMGWGSQGATYGGLLTECESEVGYSGDLLTKRKQCLTEKCNKSFGSDTQAKEGCLFLATWMEAAGNPNHTYKEVECPQALKAQF